MAAPSDDHDGARAGQGLPPADESGRWRWLKLAPGESVSAYVIVSTTYWHQTHYVGGRTIGCLGDDCPAWCHATPLRTRTFLAVSYTPPRPVVLLELGPPGVDSVGRALAVWKHLLGLRVQVTKEGDRSNSPVRLAFSKRHGEEHRWGAEPDVGAYLVRLWRETAAQVDRERRNRDTAT